MNGCECVSLIELFVCCVLSFAAVENLFCRTRDQSKNEKRNENINRYKRIKQTKFKLRGGKTTLKNACKLLFSRKINEKNYSLC